MNGGESPRKNTSSNVASSSPMQIRAISIHPDHLGSAAPKKAHQANNEAKARLLIWFDFEANCAYLLLSYRIQANCWPPIS
ncbi:MAG: hypothetical protein K1564_16835 [Candidatus Thiodiazotropha sp. (ex. Lucinisca nassula)]|nr:hypothetical protein [Candidatus Thiodiazotropha sp. (ex. Lucinisca nassula)]